MKLHRYFFWLLIFLLPVQLGRHFWFEWTKVLGLPLDYLSPTLYLTDILVVAILFSWGLEQRKKRKDKIRDILRKYWLAIAIFLFLLVNSCLAVNQNAAIYKLIKIVEFTLLGFYIAKNNYKIAALAPPLSGAVIYSSLIAVGQFFKQGAIGGLFWWLGERSFNIITPGIAKAIISGRLILRPYATFSHPNVLAGFVLVSMMLIAGGEKRGLINKIVKWLALVSGSLTIILSFSRATWLVGLLASLWLKMRGWQHWQWRILGLIIFLFVGSIFYYQFVLPLSGSETIDQRLSLAGVAMEMIEINPLAGVGLNNFVPQLPYYWQQFGPTYWLQPVHNLYLLVTAETGLMGLLIFLWFLVLTYKKLLATGHWRLLTVLSTILALGLFDHYWLTLQQSQLLLTVVFGLSWRK